MSLKTSFFSKSLFKSDIKRYWWLAVSEIFLIMLMVVLPCYEACKRSVDIIGSSYWGCEPTWFSGAIILLVVFSVGVPVLLFNYMHFTSSVSTFHSFPVKRGTIFSTKFITGIILTITPILINAVILCVFALNPIYGEHIGFLDVATWVISGIMYTLVLFSLTSMVNMMTGNPVGTLVFTAGFAFLPFILIGAFQSFFDMEVYGYAFNSVDNILTHIYIDEADLVELKYFAIYLVLAVAFSIGAYFLYRIRKLEAYGEVIAFTWLKPVFIGIISVLTSILSYFYFSGVMHNNGILWLLPLGIIGTVIAWMISKKSISPKGILKPVAIYLGLALCFVAVIHFDLTGYERRVPKLSDIESVKVVRDDSRMQWHNYGEIIYYWQKGEVDYAFYEQEDIINVIELHKNKIEKREEHNTGRTIPIEYKLKNGRVLKREYMIDFEKDAKFLKPIYETKQLRGNEYRIINGSEKEFTELSINDRRFKNSIFKTVYPDNPYMSRLISALKEDLSNITYEEMVKRAGESINIGISYIPIYDSDADISELLKTRGGEGEHYYIRDSFESTIAVLEEMGLYNEIPKDSDIESASIYTWVNAFPIKEGAYSYAEPTEKIHKEDEIKVTDKNKIAELYSLYDSMIGEVKYSNYNTCNNVRISYTLKNGHTFEVSCSYDGDKIPQELSEYFK